MEWSDRLWAPAGALRACQSFYGALKSSGHGRVINIASLSSHVAFFEVAAYSAAKTGLLGLLPVVSLWNGRATASVSTRLRLAYFLTELNSPLILGTLRGTELLQRTPMARFGKLEELACAAVLLGSDASSFLTGQRITVDGGFLASGVNQ